MEKVTTKKHRKHAAIQKKDIGQYANNEIGILGTPCGEIEGLASALAQGLSTLRTAYLDADHKTEEAVFKDAFIDGTELSVTDKISFRRIDYKASFNNFEMRRFFRETDILFVNGNHHPAAAQLVVIDSRKKLDKHFPKITNPLAVLYKTKEDKIPESLIEHYPEITNLPSFQLSETEAIQGLVKAYYTDRQAPLKALILTGGKSQRMQKDKSTLDYHGMPQRDFVHQLLGQKVEEVYLSCRADQAEELSKDYKVITDKFEGLGPLSGILSAFQHDPNAAWVVLAVDLPLFSEQSLDYLIENRNPSKVATSFRSPVINFPEPLVAIWEPKAYSVLLEFLSYGYACPRKALINSDINLLESPFAEELKNVNTPEEFEEVKGILGK